MRGKRTLLVIASAVLLLLLALGAFAVLHARPDSELVVTALDSAGHEMASMPAVYPAINPRTGELARPAKFVRFHGWAWSASGDYLSLKYSGPLSDDKYNPQAGASCPVGTDPVAAAALVNAAMAVRYPGAKQAIDLPFHPSGLFYMADLPGGGIAILRVQPGKTPAEVSATLDTRPIAMSPVSAREVLTIQLEGTPPVAADPEPMLEDEIIQADVRSYMAASESEKAAALEHARAIVQLAIDKFQQRHGHSPQSLKELVTVPGAVCSRLPLNPYAPEIQLGLGLEPAGLPAIQYVGAGTTWELSINTQ